jgi:hypothetical protein
MLLPLALADITLFVADTCAADTSSARNDSFSGHAEITCIKAENV